MAALVDSALEDLVASEDPALEVMAALVDLALADLVLEDMVVSEDMASEVTAALVDMASKD